MGINFVGAPEPMIFGTDEYLQLLRETGAKGMIILNSTSPPEESLAWVEHVVTAGADVPYWEFGNESYLKFDPSFMPVASYVQRFRDTVQAIKAEYPDLRVGAILEGSIISAEWGKYVVPEIDAWNRAVVEGTADLADFYSVHLYAPMEKTTDNEVDTLRTAMAGSAALGANLDRIRTLVDELDAGAEIRVTECNVLTDEDVANWRSSTSPAQVAFLADILLAMIRRGVAGANYWSLIGNDNFGMFKSGDEPEPRGACLLYRMLAPLAGATALATRVEGAPAMDYTPAGVVPGGLEIPVLEAQAFAQGDELYLLLINRDLQWPLRVTARLEGGAALASASSTSVSGDLEPLQIIDQSSRIRLLRRPGEQTVTVHPGSVSLIRLERPQP